MGIEIERKFRVMAGHQPWDTMTDYMDMVQGYISTDPHKTVRVRSVVPRLGKPYGCLTVKGQQVGCSRSEFEYSTPYGDADIMLKTMCDRLISKRRYIIWDNDNHWDVDVFSGDNQGLVTAEIELRYSEQWFHSPDWLGAEVTDDRRYANSNLSENPYLKWKA